MIKSDMKQTKKVRMILAGAGLLLVAVAGVFLYSWITRPGTPGIALYRIPAPLVTALTEKAKDAELTGAYSFSFILLDETQPLGPQLDKNKNRISLLFAPIGQATAALTAEVHRPAERARQLLPTTIRNAGISGRDI